MTGWGTSWDKAPDTIQNYKQSDPIPLEGDPLATKETWNSYFEKIRNNKVPTHDPYTNPNAELYYSCQCGQILDPGVKSFAALNNAASKAGWKIRFGEQYYIPYCVECGKDVE